MKFISQLPLSAEFLRCALFLACTAGALAAEKKDVIDETVAPYFRPFQNDHAAIAPDGRHLAMSENLRGKPAAIVIVKIDDQSREYFPLGDAAGNDAAAQQLLWVSPTRLVFTTRNRGIGAIDLAKREAKALLFSKDLDAYRPRAELGLRRRLGGSTPEMPADPNQFTTTIGNLPGNQVSLSDAQTLARVSGDLFGRDSIRDPGVAVRPFLVGVKPGSSDTVLVELRSDGDPLATPEIQRSKMTVPGNITVYDRVRDDIPTEGAVNPTLGYVTYDIEQSAAPLVVIELETDKGKTKELMIEHGWRRVWFDQQGRLRLALEQRGKTFRYMYCAAKGGRWVPLESVVKAEPRLGFEITSQNLLSPRSIPLGFDANGKVLYIATNVGQDTFGLRAIDVESGQLVKDFSMAHAQFDVIEPTALAADDVMQFDPYNKNLMGLRFASARRETTWLNADLAAIQTGLSKKVAPQRAEIRGWDAERTRFLVDISGPGDPGGYAIFDPAARKFVRLGDRAPWLTEERLNHTHTFDFTNEAGRRIAGMLTVPRQPRVTPSPMLIYFHDGPWFSDPPVFNRGAQALAALGFAVLQVNHRGSSGYGRAHLTATEAGLDRVVLEDVRATIDRVGSGKLPINTRLVATMGNGVGGYLAVRMAQLAPESFRCAVAINAPGDLNEWRANTDAAPSMLTDVRRHYFDRDREALRAASAVAAGKSTRVPVLVVHASEDAYVPVGMGRTLYAALKGGSPETAYLELPGEGHGGWSDETTARLFAELGRFFNATIYNFGVNVRPVEVVR